MGLFDFFKKKDTPSFDITDIRVGDLNKGFVFDYNMSTWTVEKTFEYDWGDEYFSKDHKITNGKDTYYLSVSDDDGEVEMSLLSKIKFSSLDGDLHTYIKLNEEPPSRISYEGESYSMDSGSAGFIRNGDDWDEMMSWEYFNAKEDRVLCIEQFDENEFEASCGVVLKEYEISNILPA